MVIYLDKSPFTVNANTAVKIHTLKLKQTHKKFYCKTSVQQIQKYIDKPVIIFLHKKLQFTVKQN